MQFRKYLTLSFVAGLMVGSMVTTTAAAILGSVVFPDVQSGAYFDAAIGRLYGQGIIKGGADGNFHPGDFVTRADVAVMLDRALNSGTVSVPRSSSSASVASTASSASSSTSSNVSIGDAGAFRFSVDTFSFPESATNVTLAVQRYGGTKGNVLVSYATADGTAKAGERYNQATGQVAFGDGETSKVITLKFINNLIADPNQTFTVTISSPTNGGVIGTPSTATITVLDNDGGGGNVTHSSSSSANASSVASAAGGGITFGAWSYALDEKTGPATVSVLRQGNTSSAVAVNYSTTDGTAKAGTNYTNTNGTLTFAAGETSKSFTIPLIPMGSIDGNKSFTIKLASPTNGAVLGDPSSVPFTVVDAEAAATGSGTVLFSAAEFSVSRRVAYANVTVLRRTTYAGTVTVKYATSDNTAVGGSDYTAQSGTMTFAPGESSKTFAVPLAGNVFSGEKKFNVTLSNLTGPAIFGDQVTAIVKILGQ